MSQTHNPGASNDKPVIAPYKFYQNPFPQTRLALGICSHEAVNFKHPDEEIDIFLPYTNQIQVCVSFNILKCIYGLKVLKVKYIIGCCFSP